MIYADKRCNAAKKDYKGNRVISWSSEIDYWWTGRMSTKHKMMGKGNEIMGSTAQYIDRQI